jgi:hypothetical protein
VEEGGRVCLGKELAAAASWMAGENGQEGRRRRRRKVRLRAWKRADGKEEYLTLGMRRYHLTTSAPS